MSEISSTHSFVRPEWLFELVNVLQGSLAMAGIERRRETLSEFKVQCPPISAFERQVLDRLVARRNLEQTLWDARHVGKGVDTAEVVPSTPTRRAIQIATAKELLRTNCTHRWTLESLARHVGCNRTDLEAGFREQCSCTVHAFLVKRRLDKAKDLLRTTAWRIEEVAKSAGFRSKATLYTHFRRLEHMTPDEYRRRWALLPARENVRVLLYQVEPFVLDGLVP